MNNPTERIRNVLVLGHQGSGKTTLIENLNALASKGSAGSIEKKNTISDYTIEEKNRLISTNLSLIPVEVGEIKINFIDVPGNDDFVYEFIGAVNVAEGAIICIDAQKGVEVGTIKHFQRLKKNHIPTLLLINKADKDFIKYDEVLAEIKSKFGKECLSIAYPLETGEGFNSYLDVISNSLKRFNGKELEELPVPESLKDKELEFSNALNEAIATTDDALLDKFFGGESFSVLEVTTGLKTAIKEATLYPILVGSGKKATGLNCLLDLIVNYFPSPKDNKARQGVDKENKPALRAADAGLPFSSYVFKTGFDPFKGVTSYVKVVSGTLSLGDEIYAPSNNTTMKVSSMFFLKGENQIPATKVFAGDIVIIAKLENILTGFSLCDKANVIIYPLIKYPTAVYFRSLLAVDKGNEEKLSAALQRIMMMIPSLEIKRNSETKQLLIGTVSDTHINFIQEKLKNSFGIPTRTEEPKISYRETIKGSAEANGAYVKQSGGSGFFGKVIMRFEPNRESEEENVFTDEVKGMNITKQYFPAVEKGFYEACNAGLLAGFPVVGMKAVLLDGKEHSVDSNELAFKMASIDAFRQAYLKCKPTIKEPIMKITINVLSEYTGNILNDLNQRRARIMGMDEKQGGMTEIEAQVPESEIIDYSTKLRVLTQSSGFFNRVFDSYQEVPGNLIDKIVKEVQASKENK
ncbi:MAG: elongation factor G [Erysipelotrichaceae bacterium]|jgi:elongation factor G|nr:elongation factor G [Erysipelotrichaceae bacterium]